MVIKSKITLRFFCLTPLKSMWQEISYNLSIFGGCPMFGTFSKSVTLVKVENKKAGAELGQAQFLLS